MSGKEWENGTENTISKVKHRKIANWNQIKFQSFFQTFFFDFSSMSDFQLWFCFVAVFCPAPFKSKLVILSVWVGVCVYVFVYGVRAKFNFISFIKLIGMWISMVGERNGRTLDFRSKCYDLQGDIENENERRFIQNHVICTVRFHWHEMMQKLWQMDFFGIFQWWPPLTVA